MSLSAQERVFVAEYVKTGNAESSVRIAYDCSKKSVPAVSALAARVKNKKDVKEAVEIARRKIGDAALFSVEEVMREWMDIATADPNELTSYQRRCCRHCYGINHEYQWANQDEWAAAVASVVDTNATAKRGKHQGLPSSAGGFGYDFTKRPHPECIKCRGEGIGTTFMHDTTKLSKKARKLFAGVQETSHGIKILMRDQDAALVNFAKALGMFTEQLQITGAAGGPVATAALPMPTDPIEAAKLYQQIMKGSK